MILHLIFSLVCFLCLLTLSCRVVEAHPLVHFSRAEHLTLLSDAVKLCLITLEAKQEKPKLQTTHSHTHYCTSTLPRSIPTLLLHPLLHSHTLSTRYTSCSLFVPFHGVTSPQYWTYFSSFPSYIIFSKYIVALQVIVAWCQVEILIVSNLSVNFVVFCHFIIRSFLAKVLYSPNTFPALFPLTLGSSTLITPSPSSSLLPTGRSRCEGHTTGQPRATHARYYYIQAFKMRHAIGSSRPPTLLDVANAPLLALLLRIVDITCEC